MHTEGINFTIPLNHCEVNFSEFFTMRQIGLLEIKNYKSPQLQN